MSDSIPSGPTKPAGEKDAGGRFRIASTVKAQKEATPQPETEPRLIAIRYPKPGDVITYEAEGISETANSINLHARGEGDAKGPLIAIFNKQTGAIIESVDPVSVEHSGTRESDTRGFLERFFNL